jgi:signal transduction histidine kinase
LISPLPYLLITVGEETPLVTTYDRADPPIREEPLRLTMARLAVGLRVSAAAVVSLAAVLGATPPVRLGWLAAALALWIGWTLVYAAGVRRYGVRARLAAVDLAVAGVIATGLGRLVPTDALPGGSSWVVIVVSVAVICAQFIGRPWLTVPGGLAVAACYLTGAHFARSPDHGLAHGFTLVLQAGITAWAVAVMRRADLRALVVLDDFHTAARAGAVERARRDAERAELRLLHNGPLTTLTMVAVGGLSPDSFPALRERATADVAALRSGPEPDGPNRPVRLDESLAATVERFQPPLIVRLQRDEPSTVPSAVADAIAAATAEALENVARHAGTPEATVHIGRSADGGVLVAVTDAGRGFNPNTVPVLKFGLREAIRGQLAQVGGRARIRSTPGHGTTVEMTWPA